MSTEQPMDVETNVARSPPAKAPTDFEKQLLRYRKQLETGCGRPNCDSLFCASNPGLKKFTLLPKDMSMLAMKLAIKHKGTDTFLCPDTPTNNFEIALLDFEKLDAMFQECKASGVYTPVIRLLGRIFSDHESLGLSFLKSPQTTDIDGSDMGLDFDQVSKTFALIFTNTPENVHSVMASSIERLFNELNRIKPRTDPLTQLRIYTLLLENPKCVGMKYLRQTSLLFHLLSKLPTKMHTLLEKSWVSRFDLEKFNFFFNNVQDFITLKILGMNTKNENAIHGDTGIPAATKFLQYLWNLNKERKYLDEEPFYNHVLNENFSLRVDYFQWKGIGNVKDRFSFCLHPFILTPETKSQVLNIESLLNQRKLQQESLQMLGQGIMDLPFLVFSIRREKLMEESIDMIAAVKVNDASELQKQLRIKFHGEEGVDAGGVKKEWFQLLIAEIFSFDYGMFIPDDDSKTYWFNSKSQDFIQYELLGTIMGLAIYNGVILDLSFPNYVYKRLLGFPYDDSDLLDVYPAIARVFKQLEDYEGDDYEVFDLNFVHTFEYLDQVQTHELIPGGQDITVTKDNVKLYLETYKHYLMQDAVKRQLEAFVTGFKLVCDGSAIKLFTPKELQLLICGSPELDFEELEKGTTYDNGYDKNHPTVRAFWKIVHGFSLDMKKKLLFFATGSDRAPIGGLAKMNFIITMHGDDTNRLPTAHTCFNHLFLPPYADAEKQKELLEKAISNTTGFGLI